MTWEKENYPCPNVLCRINSQHYCDAGEMLDLLCSSSDVYEQCKERKYCARLIKNLGIKITKNSKGNFIVK